MTLNALRFAVADIAAVEAQHRDNGIAVAAAMPAGWWCRPISPLGQP